MRMHIVMVFTTRVGIAGYDKELLLCIVAVDALYGERLDDKRVVVVVVAQTHFIFFNQCIRIAPFEDLSAEEKELGSVGAVDEVDSRYRQGVGDVITFHVTHPFAVAARRLRVGALIFVCFYVVFEGLNQDVTETALFGVVS